MEAVEEKKQIDDVVEMVVDAVRDLWCVFQGHDSEGFLACYEAEMKS